MKISCEIVKDLLPLYYDDVCSDESKAAIEAHFISCESCTQEWQAMKEALSFNKPKENLKDSEAVKKLSKRWRRGMKKSIAKGILIGAITIIVVALLLFLIMDIRIVYAY